MQVAPLESQVFHNFVDHAGSLSDSNLQATLFAPTDSAFAALKMTRAQLLALPSLKDILRMHISPMVVQASGGGWSFDLSTRHSLYSVFTPLFGARLPACLKGRGCQPCWDLS